MKERIWVMAFQAREALGAFRGYADLRVRVLDDEIWLKGCSSREETEALLSRLPIKQSYELDEQGYIFPLQGLTPTGKLPEGEWLPVSQIIRPEFPVSALPGKVTEPYQVRIVPSDQVQSGSALLCDGSVWKNYADSAPEVRLSCLRFAVSESKRVLVTGSPLPAIPGQEYWQRDCILLPCGYDFEIPFISALLARQLNPQTDSFLLFDTAGNWDRIEYTYLVPATRSGVRLTLEDPSDAS